MSDTSTTPRFSQQFIGDVLLGVAAVVVILGVIFAIFVTAWHFKDADSAEHMRMLDVCESVEDPPDCVRELDEAL